MYHSDAIELARGGATVAAIVHRNRSVFPPPAVASETSVNRAQLNMSASVQRVAPVSPDAQAISSSTSSRIR
jgi:hypothetical protein